MASRVVIALGSNLGDRLAHLQQARDALRAIALTETFFQSSIYQTEPVLCPQDSPNFYNAVVSFDYNGAAEELHQQTRAIENALGRAQTKETNAPRIIDLDILLFGEFTVDREDLIIPHPRMHLRRFVLEPLCEIHPQLIIPSLHGPVQQHLALLNSSEAALVCVTRDW